MMRSGKGGLVLLAAGVICLIGSAVMWWDALREGLAFDSAIRPAAFTIMGLFWVLFWHKTKDARGNGGNS
jgi:hypothetical protein